MEEEMDYHQYDNLIQINNDKDEFYLETLSGITDNNTDENDNPSPQLIIKIEEEKKKPQTNM